MLLHVPYVDMMEVMPIPVGIKVEIMTHQREEIMEAEQRLQAELLAYYMWLNQLQKSRKRFDLEDDIPKLHQVAAEINSNLKHHKFESVDQVEHQIEALKAVKKGVNEPSIENADNIKHISVKIRNDSSRNDNLAVAMGVVVALVLVGAMLACPAALPLLPLVGAAAVLMLDIAADCAKATNQAFKTEPKETPSSPGMSR